MPLPVFWNDILGFKVIYTEAFVVEVGILLFSIDSQLFKFKIVEGTF